MVLERKDVRTNRFLAETVFSGSAIKINAVRMADIEMTVTQRMDMFFDSDRRPINPTLRAVDP